MGKGACTKAWKYAIVKVLRVPGYQFSSETDKTRIIMMHHQAGYKRRLLETHKFKKSNED